MRAVAAAMAVGLALGAAGAWWVQGQRATAAMAQVQQQHAQQLADQSTQALTTYQRMETTKDAAIQAAEQRAAQNRADADRSRAAADGLRGDLARMPARISAASRAAVDEYAATSGELLGACTARYQQLAEQADGHAADARLMREAWPVQSAP